MFERLNDRAKSDLDGIRQQSITKVTPTIAIEPGVIKSELRTKAETRKPAGSTKGIVSKVAAL